MRGSRKFRGGGVFAIPLAAALALIPALPASSQSEMKMGMYTELTVQNGFLTRDLNTYTDDGYEYDSTKLYSNLGWWFYGKVNDFFELDAGIKVFDFTTTLYQASVTGGDDTVEWRDGIENLLSKPFGLLWETQENAGDYNGRDDFGHGYSGFSRLELNFASPYVDARIGYGDLGRSGMTEFTGIYGVIDRSLWLPYGYFELKNGRKTKKIGDLKIDALLAVSRANLYYKNPFGGENGGTYGTYDYLDVKYGDLIEAALTWGCATYEEKLFDWGDTYWNALSAYVAVTPVEDLKLEAHALGTFGTGVDLDAATSALAARVSYEAQTWRASVSQSFAGDRVNSVWGTDARYEKGAKGRGGESGLVDSDAYLDNDMINPGFTVTTLLAEKDFSLDSLDITVGLDEWVRLDSSDFGGGLMTFRTQPYADFKFGGNFSVGVYGVLNIDRTAEAQSRDGSGDQFVVPYFREAGVEFAASDVASFLQSVTVDYALTGYYRGWSSDYQTLNSDDQYELDTMYHTIILEAQFTDRYSAFAGSVIRAKDDGDDTAVPFGIAVGGTVKNIPLPGKPMLWARFSYGAGDEGAYSGWFYDQEYHLYRADDWRNDSLHRSYLMNQFVQDTACYYSFITLGLVWNL